MSKASGKALTPSDVAAARSLAQEVAEHDGVAAFSEDTLLTLGDADRDHLLIRFHGDLAGFAQVAHGSAELAVAPRFRRRGVGRELAQRVLGEHQARLWAHGDLEPARALAAALALTPVRELWRMARTPGRAGEQGPTPVPPQLRVSTFVVGSDEQQWLALNARAFADHPEQGQLNQDDLRARMAQEWFDPRTFWLARDRDSGALLGSLWAKVTAGPPATGEIYALGVDPVAQGRGVGSALTAVAMEHFAAAGLDRLELYVEAENTAAIRTYTRAGFGRDAVHVQYARRSPTPLP